MSCWYSLLFPSSSLRCVLCRDVFAGQVSCGLCPVHTFSNVYGASECTSWFVSSRSCLCVTVLLSDYTALSYKIPSQSPSPFMRPNPSFLYVKLCVSQMTFACSCRFFDSMYSLCVYLCVYCFLVWCSGVNSMAPFPGSWRCTACDAHLDEKDHQPIGTCHRSCIKT